MKLQYNSKKFSLLLLSGFLVSQQAYAMDDPNNEGFPRPLLGQSPTLTEEEIAAKAAEEKRRARHNKRRDEIRKERAEKGSAEDQKLKQAEKFFTDLANQGKK
jgi:hypothetical protein